MVSDSGRIRQILGPALARLRAHTEKATKLATFTPDGSATDKQNWNLCKLAILSFETSERSLGAAINTVETQWDLWNQLVEEDENEGEEQEKWTASDDHNVVVLLELAVSAKASVDEFLGAARIRCEEYEEGVSAAAAPTVVPVSSARPAAILVSDPPRLSLPVLRPPMFDGQISEWTQFYEIFITTVDNQPIPPVQKLAHLVSLLKGEAKRLVDGYSIESSNYEEVKGLLIRTYGRREIIESKLMDELVNLSRPTESAPRLRAFVRDLDRIRRQLEKQGTHLDSAFTVQEVQRKLPHRVLEELVRVRAGKTNWNLEILCSELNSIVEIREELERLENLRINGSSGRPAVQSKVLVASSFSFSCLFCDKVGHKSADCFTVTDQKLRKQILFKKKRCFCCLSASHSCTECNRNCLLCGGRHHSSICFGARKTSENLNTDVRSATKHPNELQTARNRSFRSFGTGSNSEPIGNAKNLKAAISRRSEGPTVQSVLPIVRVQVQNLQTQKTIEVSALLDSGSNESYITENLMNTLGLESRSEVEIMADIFGGTNTNRIVGQKVELGLWTKSKKMRISAIAIPKLLTELPVSRVENGKVKTQVEEPQMLIGKHLVWSVFRIPRKQTLEGFSYIETDLGPVIVETPSSERLNNRQSLLCHQAEGTQTQSFNQDLDNYWKMESVGIDSRELDQSLDEAIRKQFQETAVFDSTEGRYFVDWLWNGRQIKLPTNFEIAFFRTKTTLNRLGQDGEKLDAYRKDFENQQRRGTIERVTWKEISGIEHYLPHRPVWTPQKDTTKLRVVYDASAKQKNGISLNDCLYKGPSSVPLLVSVLLRFRLNTVVVISDIEKAFHSIRLKENQRDSTRFLLPLNWKKPLSFDNLQIYRFTSVGFGFACSPSLLSLAIEKQLDGEEKCLKNMYVDNIILGYSSVEDAVEDSHRLKEKLNQAHFNLREFYSNKTEIMKQLNPNEKKRQTKVLGLIWDLQADVLRIQPPVWIENYTKRGVMSYVSSFYDPCGFLLPSIIQAKVFQQTLWKRGLEWDEKFDEECRSQWNQLILQDAEFSIPREIIDFNKSTNDLMVFCDASNSAYGAVAYVLTGEVESRISTLVFAKAKLMPLNGNFTIPRAELMAVLVGVRMSQFLEQQMGPFGEIVVWSDSEIVLKQISNEKDKHSVFVQRRLQEIREHRVRVSFRYVGTRENSADLLSRGCSVDALKSNRSWWKGPDYLIKDKSEWPDSVVINLNEQPEVSLKESGVFVVNQPVSDFKFIDPNRGNWSKMIRIGLKVLEATNRFKKRKVDNESLWVKVQRVTHLMIHDAQKSNPPSQRKELKFRLFEDDLGLIRCRTRLPEKVIGYAAANPIWLPENSSITNRLIYHVHLELCHAGAQAVLSSLRSIYWVSSSAVKLALKDCFRCRHFHAKPFAAPVAD